jgi:hypothetical protein
MHLFMYLAEGPWGVGPDICTMNLGPLPGGADLEYGTGPYIWTGGTAGFQYIMTAYRAGVSYGGITEQNSYFWAPVRLQDTGSGAEPESTTGDVTLYKSGTGGYAISPVQSGGKVWLNYTVHNYDNYNAMAVQIQGQYDYYYWSGAAWVADGGVKTTNTISVTIPAGGTYKANMSKTDTDIAAMPTDTYIVWWEGFTITYVAPSPAWTVGMVVTSGDFWQRAQGVKMWSDNEYYMNRHFEIINVNPSLLSKANVNGDAIININDIGPIAANWLQHVPLGGYNGVINPRADVNQDGIININDIGPIAANWLTSTTAVPADPAVPGP